jgi:hypothetical protein
LKGLKERGFRVVHVVPAAPGRPKTYSEPQQWAAHGYKRPPVVIAEGNIDSKRPVPSRLSLDLAAKPIAAFTAAPAIRPVMAAAGEEIPLPQGLWTEEDRAAIPDDMTRPAAGMDRDWPGQFRLASLTSAEDAEWPPAKAEISNKNTAAPAKAAKRSANTCRASEPTPYHPRCKKPPAGHQLSLTDKASPDRLRSLYSF